MKLAARGLVVLALVPVVAACSSATEDVATGSSADDGVAADGGAYCSEPGRFDVSGGVVIDLAGDGTLVEWQRGIAPAPMTQPDAVAYCEALVLDGDGWRLPSVYELASLVLHPIGLGASVTPTCVPSIDQIAFPGTPAEDFWSATTRPALDDALYTGFYDGRSHADVPDAPKGVRCVRTQGDRT